MYSRQMFYGMLAGNVAISLVFLIGRLIDGMPFFEAFGKFWFAVLLIAFINAAAMGAAMYISEVFFNRKGK